MNTCDSTLCMYRNMFSHAYTWGVFNMIRSIQQIESMGELTLSKFTAELTRSDSTRFWPHIYVHTYVHPRPLSAMNKKSTCLNQKV